VRDGVRRGDPHPGVAGDELIFRRGESVLVPGAQPQPPGLPPPPPGGKRICGRLPRPSWERLHPTLHGRALRALAAQPRRRDHERRVHRSILLGKAPTTTPTQTRGKLSALLHHAHASIVCCLTLI
jgi:hypothetical protein